MSVFGDIYDIESRVKEIDPLLTITYDEKKRKYTVSRNRHKIMVVDSLDCRILSSLRKNDLHRRRLEDFIRELEHSEDMAERLKAREMSNRIESVLLDGYDQIAGIPHFSIPLDLRRGLH